MLFSRQSMKPFWQAYIWKNTLELSNLTKKKNQLDIFDDSHLVVNLIMNNFDIKGSSMAAYIAQAQLVLKHFHYQITHVP